MEHDSNLKFSKTVIDSYLLFMKESNSRIIEKIIIEAIYWIIGIVKIMLRWILFERWVGLF